MKARIPITLFAIGLAGCGEMEREEYQPQKLVSDVQRVMCEDDAAERAHAIASVSQKSEGRPLGEVSQEVYDIASEVADKGCAQMERQGAKP